MLRAVIVGKRAGRTLDRLKAWALEVQSRTNHNKAACALGNNLALLCGGIRILRLGCLFVSSAYLEVKQFPP